MTWEGLAFSPRREQKKIESRGGRARGGPLVAQTRDGSACTEQKLRLDAWTPGAEEGEGFVSLPRGERGRALTLATPSSRTNQSRRLCVSVLLLRGATFNLGS